MVGETAGVGVLLVDDETAFVVEQPVEHVWRLVRARGDDIGMVRPELIQQIGVELHTWVLTGVQVVATPDFALAAGTKELRSEDEVVPRPQ